MIPCTSTCSKGLIGRMPLGTVIESGNWVHHMTWYRQEISKIRLWNDWALSYITRIAILPHLTACLLKVLTGSKACVSRLTRNYETGPWLEEHYPRQKSLDSSNTMGGLRSTGFVQVWFSQDKTVLASSLSIVIFSLLLERQATSPGYITGLYTDDTIWWSECRKYSRHGAKCKCI